MTHAIKPALFVSIHSQILLWYKWQKGHEKMKRGWKAVHAHMQW